MSRRDRAVSRRFRRRRDLNTRPTAGHPRRRHGEYVVPTLLGFRRLTDVVGADLEDHVAEQVWIAVYNPSSDAELSCDRIAGAVQEKGAASLARKIRKRCAEPP